ncbi:MAG: methylthioribulose 1-phosphate dehydratase [Curvibacter sp.]|nr:methylthioribulose 1-phosphate dehydratase [Curvibacter sp.]
MATLPARPLDPQSWQAAAEAVIEVGRRAARRGWLPATSGNLSVRAGDLLAITRSGVDKGALSEQDLLAQALDAPLLPGSSAEAALHLQLYADRPGIAAVFHVHSLAASVLGRRHVDAGELVFQGWELQKALAGVDSHEQRVRLPIFPNTQDIPFLVRQVRSRLGAASGEAWNAPGYLIAGHGLYAWGCDSAEAWRHLEALDHLLNQELALAGPTPLR